MFGRTPLSERYPPDCEVIVRGEKLTTPYYVYDGTLLFIGGTADAGDVSRLLADEDDLMPIIDTAGRALAGIWIGDFGRANLGPHSEFQISLFATSRKAPVSVPSHPFSTIRATLALPETVMVCHGLWNTTERVVSYNRDVLALDAQWSAGTLSQSGEDYDFSFTDADDGSIAEGHLGIKRQKAADSRTMMHCVGFTTLLKAAFAPAATIPVANTRSDASPGKLVSRTYSRFRSQVTRLFDAGDRLTIRQERYRDLGFEPTMVQQLQGYELVFMRPKPRET